MPERIDLQPAGGDDAAVKESAPRANRPSNRPTPLILARHVSLQVPVFLPHERQILTNPIKLVTDLYMARTRRTFSVLLEDINLKLMPGERLGLIGPNGAGKTTLLKVLAGIYKPSTGKVQINGEATGMFGIALGMLPEATGLENIYMRGLQMGLTLKQIRALVPEVVTFAELEDVIERPLNTYSAGMRMRLTVAVATMVKPDILLMDEWIGAGDAHFQTKFRKRMMDVVETSRGLVIATHNPSLMNALCTRAAVLKQGKLLFSGPVQEAQKFYKEHARHRQ